MKLVQLAGATMMLCAVLALAACGGGGGSAPAVAPSTGLVVNWVSRSGASSGNGTQADPIHLAYPPLGVNVTVARGGVAQQFNLSTDTSCTAVSLATNSLNAFVGPGSGDPVSSGVAFASGSTPSGPWDVSWSIVSASKGACSVTATTIDGVRATLQVYSEI